MSLVDEERATVVGVPSCLSCAGPSYRPVMGGSGRGSGAALPRSARATASAGYFPLTPAAPPSFLARAK